MNNRCLLPLGNAELIQRWSALQRNLDQVRGLASNQPVERDPLKHNVLENQVHLNRQMRKGTDPQQYHSERLNTDVATHRFRKYSQTLLIAIILKIIGTCGQATEA